MKNSPLTIPDPETLVTRPVRRMLLQWHITDRCNLRCDHCYQDTYFGAELQYSGFINILDQFMALLDMERDRHRSDIWGHVTITGGEPFVREDFPDMLEELRRRKDRVSFAVLTNGSFIDKKMAARLKELGVSFVQVSLEGKKKTHNTIRGAGDHERTVKAIKYLVKNKVRTLISFTAHRENFKEFADVARLGRRLNVSRVWADRLIPHGSGCTLNTLTPEETKEFLIIMDRQRKSMYRWFSKTEIHMGRALQFLQAGGTPYQCAAADTLVTVMPDGTLYPCRRMPIAAGNLLETPLTTLYYESELFKKLRDKEHIPEGCGKCHFSRLCRGGLRCLANAVKGSPLAADPGCWFNLINRPRIAAT